MASRIELGGFRVSRGEQSFGELRPRYYVEVPQALQMKALEVLQNNTGYSNIREVYADMLAGEFDELLAEDNEVNPDDYDREEWIGNYDGDVPDSVDTDGGDD